MRRKGERPYVHPPLIWSERCTIRHMIETGDRWLYAWIVQQCVGTARLSKKTKIPHERINKLFYGAVPTDDELALLCGPFRTDVTSLLASIEFEGLSRAWECAAICKLYNIKVTRLEFNDYFHANDDARRQAEVAKDYVSPGNPGYVVREEDGTRILSEMLWGFPHQGKPVTNVRNYASPFWKSALMNPARRCLVPVTEFQEWSAEPLPETGKKKAFWFSVPSQPIFAFAGIWRPTDTMPVFSFLTTGYDGDAANHLVGAIHPKAIPVILHPEDYDRWLRTDLDDALSLASAYPSQLMAVR